MHKKNLLQWSFFSSILLSISLSSSLAAFPFYEIPKKAVVFLGFGIGAECGFHDYDFQDIGGSPDEPYKVGNSRDLNGNIPMNALGMITAGMRFPIKNNIFVGFGFDANLGKHLAQYRVGDHEYELEAFWENGGGRLDDLIPALVPFEINIQKDWDLKLNLQAGHQSLDKRFYVKVSIVHTQLTYSFIPGQLLYMKNGFNNHKENVLGIQTGLGAEFKINPNVWLGFEINFPLYNTNNTINKTFIDKYGDIDGTITIINGNSRNIQFGFNIKYEI